VLRRSGLPKHVDCGDPLSHYVGGDITFDEANSAPDFDERQLPLLAETPHCRHGHFQDRSGVFNVHQLHGRT
jgi:hypothetical protein